MRMLDLMDGHFVTNRTWVLPVVESLRKVNPLAFGRTFMIEDPTRYPPPIHTRRRTTRCRFTEACRISIRTFRLIRGGRACGVC